MSKKNTTHATVSGISEAPDSFDSLLQATDKESQLSGFAGGRLKRPSISEQVADRILAMVKSGNLTTDDQLPTEQQMCIAFGISRPPLREALKALTVMGVLESRQGGRYSVTDLSPSRLIAPFNIMLSVADYDVETHFDARAVVDLELVRLCTERASDEVRQNITRLAKDGKSFFADPVGFRLLDIEFHQAINHGADNPFLAAMSEALYDVALDLRRIASQSSRLIKKSVRQHCDVANAIQARDADAAVAAFRLHLEHVRDTTIQLSSN